MAIVSAANLVSDLFSEKIKAVPTRDGYGQGLLELGRENPDIVVLTGDLKESTRAQLFEEKYPDRFIECGVAEQNMTGVAAGLALAGKIPFISSYAVFSPGRAWEQIRVAIAYSKANVKIAGAHTGVSVGPDGATHQALEDLSIMRVLPNMTVIAPCDALETKKATLAAAKHQGPVYFRFAREASPLFTSQKTPFRIGSAEIYWRSEKPKVGIIGIGPLLYRALEAARELEKEAGVGSIVLNCHTLKPIDRKAISELAKRTGALVTVEEHQCFGGLFGAVSEVLAEFQPTPIEPVGMDDQFGESGQPDELLKKFNMTTEDIVKAALRAVKRRQSQSIKIKVSEN